MTEFLMGIITAIVLVFAFRGLNRMTDIVTSYLMAQLKDDDKKTLSILLRFRIDKLIEILGLLLVFFVGYFCKAIVG